MPASAPVTAVPAPAAAPAPADAGTRYVFGWGDLPADLAKPRGGSSRGAPVTLAPAQALPLAAIAAAPDAFARDRAAILALAGDYRVSFHFMESVGLTPDYQPVRPYNSWATEHVRVIADTGRFISLQHTLVMFFKEKDDSISGPELVKHWRQDWTYEDEDLHTYRGDNTWAHRRLSATEAAGTWSQAVFQVDDSPRYEAFGRWEHTGNVSAWTGDNEMRPLPRREYTIRKDYSVMEGQHRIILTPTGWLHEQRNWKRVAGEAGGEPHYLAQELGLDRYERITAPSLAAADDDWKKTGPYWAAVRKVWSDILAQNDRFSLRNEVDGSRLYELHFAYTEKLEDGHPYDPADGERHARETIARFLVIPKAP
ncbi:MAG: DUF6607 family protein [Lacunisphaera sp.]